jgi:hypothetical protein
MGGGRCGGPDIAGVATTAVNERSNAAGRDREESDGRDDGVAELDNEKTTLEEAHGEELERGAVGMAAGRSIRTGLGLRSQSLI